MYIKGNICASEYIKFSIKDTNMLYILQLMYHSLMSQINMHVLE